MKKLIGNTTDVGNVSVDVDYIGTIEEECIERIVDTFNIYGVVILSIKLDIQPDSSLLALSSLFGRVASHQLANKYGVYDIRPVEESKSQYPGTSSKKHPLHTDGAFLKIPEKVVCLQCVKTSESGGTSIISSGQLVFDKLKEKLSNDEISGLFDEDAIYIERDGEKICNPIFFKFDSGKGVGLRFRNDQYADIKVSEKARKGYDCICSIIADDNNVMKIDLKPGNIMIIDNYRILHGRTEFDPSGYRHFKRMNCHGDGTLINDVQYGIDVNHD